MNTYLSLMVSTVLTLVTVFFSLVAPECAQSAVVSFSRTDLENNLGPGGDLWEYQYTVSDPGAVFAENVGFSIYFPAALYRDLESPPPVVNADWDVLTLQPVPGIPASGIYDALSLSVTPSLLAPFTVRFVWLGNPGTQPGSQLFEVNEFDGAGNFVSKLESGFTVPEPATASFCVSALAVVLAARRRNRAAWMAVLLTCVCGGASVFAQGAADITLESIEKVSERRVTRTVFEYTYRARAKNNGTGRHRGVTAQIFPFAGGVTMTDDAVAFGNILPGARADGADTFTFRLDRTQPFDPASLFFAFTVAPPEAPAITNLTAPANAARGTAFTVEFDYTDADGDIQVLGMSRHDALMNVSGEYSPSIAGITGESGHATFTFDSNALPFGPAEFTVYLQDSLFQTSSVETFTVNVVGEANTGVAPVVTAFASVAASYDRPAGAHDTVQAQFSLAITDADSDLALVRVRITPPGGVARVADLPVANLALTGTGGSVTAPLLGFDTASQNGNYTVQVTPFDRNGHAGTPASATVSLVSSGGAVPRLFLGGTSVVGGGPGEEVDIAGSGFATPLAAQTLFEIGEMPCEVVSITATTARIRIPVGARTGPITAVNPNGSTAMAAMNFVVPEHVVLAPAADESIAVSVGATVTFSATIGSGREDKSLTWSVNGIAGGSAALGTISAEGVYTAPAAIPTGGVVQITASLTVAPAVVSAATPVTIQPPPASPGSASVLAALGGTVPSADQRAQVGIPPGALAANTTITARALAQAELPSSGPGRRTLGGAEFGPSGTAFSSPVTITIPLTVSRPPGTALRCRFYQGGGVFVDEGVTAIVNSSGSAATTAITHFSIPIVDEAAPVSPPLTAPVLTGISPTEIDEGSCRPIRLTGAGLTDDLRVEIRNGDGSPVSLGEMGPRTLYVASTSAGFVLSSGAIGGFDSGTRTYRVRLVRSHDDSLFAEIPFTVLGLPEFIVAPEELVILENPGLMRVSKVFVGERARVLVRSGVLMIESLGDVEINGLISSRGRTGVNADHQLGGAGGGTGGAGGLGREDGDIFLFGFHSPESENFGRHGNDPVGYADTDYQLPTPRTLQSPFNRTPRGLGGPPGHNAKISVPIPNPVSIALAVRDLISSSVNFVDRDLPSRRGLGAPAFSSFPQPSGGGGGGGGRFTFSTLSLVDIDVYGGGGGGGGEGGAGIQIRTARTVIANRTGGADARGGNGGDGANRSTLGVSLLFGLIPIYEDPDVDAFSGGGGGGGRSGTIEFTGAEGIFLESETDQMSVGGGKGGKGGVVDVDVENETVNFFYAASPATDGENFTGARKVNRPIFPERTFLPQVTDRGLMRLASEPTYHHLAGVVIDVTGEGAGQRRTITANFNETTNRYEATVLLYPGFNRVVDPMVGSDDPLRAPRVLVLGADADNDGLTTADEADLGTDPNVADTDADGVNDGAEAIAGTNPLRPPAGALDPAFAPTLAQLSGGVVNCVAVQPNGKILAAGQFFFIRGQARNGIARFNVDGSLDTTFDPGAGLPSSTFEQIYCMAVQPNGKIVIGGDFLSFAGESRGGIARLNADGTLESTSTFNPGSGVNPAAKVLSVAVQADNKIVVAGNFTTFDGAARRGIVRLLPNGTLESTATFNPGTGPSGPFGSVGVSGATLQPDGKILLYGSLMSVNGQPRGGIARLLTDGSVEDASTFDPGSGLGFFESIKSAAVQGDGRIVIGGDFTSVNGQPRSAIARLLGNGALESTAAFNVGTGVGGEFGTGQVLSLAVQGDGKIVLGGQFVSVDGQPRNNIARLNPDGSVESTATFDAGTGTAGAFGNGGVFGVALQGDGKILLGGEFTSVNGRRPGKLARLGTTGVPEIAPAFDPGAIIRSSNPGIVNGIAMQPDGKIIVTGQFNSVNGAPCGSITRFNPDGTVDATFIGAGSDSPIFCAAVQTDGKIVIGGQFNEIGGSPRYRLARLLADGTLDGTFTPDLTAPGQVNCVTIEPDGKILIGGDFSGVAGNGKPGVARLLANGAPDPTFNVGTGVTQRLGVTDYPGYVYALARQPNGRIIVGGLYDRVNGTLRSSLARLLDDGSLDSGFDPGVGGGFSPTINCIALRPDGRILIGGGFTSIGAATRVNLAQLNSSGTPTSETFPGGADQFVSSIVLQADGKALVGGAFDNLLGVPRPRFARLLPDCTLEATAGFASAAGTDNYLNAIAVRADGQIFVGGDFTIFAGVPRSGLALLKNDEATATLSALSSNEVQWLRGGTAPDASAVAFEVSTNGGATWTPLGAAFRIAGGWNLAGLNLTGSGTLRASARVHGGEHGGSAGLVEQSTTFTFPGPSYAPAFMRWTQTHLDGADASELGDPDSDGIANLVEYALSLAPQTPDAAPFAATRFKYADGERLRIFLQRDPSRNDVTIEVEAADNIAGPWEVIATSERGTPFTGGGYVGGDSTASGVKTVEIRDTVNIVDAPARFLRVKVVR